MANQTITLGMLPAQAARAARALSDPQALRPAMLRAKLMMVSEAKKNIAEGHDPDGAAYPPLAFARPGGGNKPLWNQGLLLASISGRSDGTSAAAGTNLVQAAIQQFGGTVVATNAQFLTIPLTPEASRAGGARRFPEPLHAIVNSATGKGVLADSEGTAQYALVKQVVIPTRPFLGFGRSLLQRLTLMFQEFVDTLVTKK